MENENLDETPQIPAPDPASSIKELQSVFGSILVARKDVKPTPSPEPAQYKWTGSFALFSFPRELRDRIYYHYVYRPNGILYRRSHNCAFPFNDKSEGILALFLTSKQVYEEALQVFCRYNQIDVAGRSYYRQRFCYGLSLQGVLRLFPDRPSRLIQRVQNQYLPWGQFRNCPGAAFVQMLNDAYILKDHFPKLREFTAQWNAEETLLTEYMNVDSFTDRTEEEKEDVWFRFMKKALRQAAVVPPVGIRFQFSDGWCTYEMEKNAPSLNAAYTRLLRETAEERAALGGLEDSGKRWLEDEARVTAQEWRRRKKEKRRGLV